jgi:hypothetical protein
MGMIISTIIEHLRCFYPQLPRGLIIAVTFYSYIQTLFLSFQPL